MNVLRIETQWEKDNKKAVHELKGKVDRGEVIGIAVVAVCRDGTHCLRASGQALDHPDLVSGLLMRLQWSLIARQECCTNNL